MNPIEAQFPALAADGYSITSPKAPRYNCIAWAADDVRRWWEPDLGRVYYWPSGVPREMTLDAYIQAYATKGYTVCANGDAEVGVEKIALYADHQNRPTHAARQLEDGTWTSKLGMDHDIQHNTPSGVEGVLYGQVVVFLSRPRGVVLKN